MLRAVAPDPELLEWLRSEDGDKWRSASIQPVDHNRGAFATIKWDHECGYSDDRCSSGWMMTPWVDVQIRSELDAYGLNRVSESWKREWELACGMLALNVTPQPYAPKEC